MQSFRLTFVAASLGLCDLLLDAAVELTRLEFRTLARRHGVFYSQIQADRLFCGNGVHGRTLHGQAEPPITDRVLSETAGFPSLALQQPVFKYSDRFTAKT